MSPFSGSPCLCRILPTTVQKAAKYIPRLQQVQTNALVYFCNNLQRGKPLQNKCICN